MNIYIHVEISVREFDSKLLLATLAASKGHQVIVSDMTAIEKGLRRRLLAPGIIHTKSLTPTKKKIARHQNIIDNGFKITSIDEEAGLDIKGYDQFSNTRYSENMIEQASAIFGWGADDVETLKKKYPKHLNKIYKTGSPRVDMWRPLFSDYWKNSVKTPARPFLLISSNMNWGNNELAFYKLIKKRKSDGYYQRDSKLFYEHFGRTSEHYLTSAAFIKAIKYLSEYNNGYDIVLRPHPAESIEAWKVYLKGIPNVHVVREGSISAWVNSAFAVMHNACTTAFESTISGKPLFTYLPYKQEYENGLPNELGDCIKTPQELLEKVNALYDNLKLDNNKNDYKSIPSILSKKVFIDENELAAYKILKIWESLANDNLSKTQNWIKFQWYLKALKFRGAVSKILNRTPKNNFEKDKKNQKFPPLDRQDVINRITKIKKILSIDAELECKLISERTILIKRC